MCDDQTESGNTCSAPTLLALLANTAALTPTEGSSRIGDRWHAQEADPQKGYAHRGGSEGHIRPWADGGRTRGLRGGGAGAK